MKPKSSSLVIGIAALAAPFAARAAEYYVAPTGSDSAAGTMAAPFATVERGQQAASAGDTVWIRGGVYMFSGTSDPIAVGFSKAGGTNNPIKYFAYPGETPIFDLYNLKPQERVTGLDVHTNWIHVRGLEVRGVQQQVTGDCWSVRLQGSNNVIENLNIHHGQAPGIFITSGANNLILNCDSHENYDPLEGGGNGDGFGCHSSGGGNVIRGCRAWSNSDDGYDFINAAGSCTVEQSWSWSNGYQPGTMTAAGNGAGFKAGGYGSPPSTPSTGAATHNVRQCVAFRNRAQGFYANHHPGRINFYNNTAINNPANFNMTADSGYPSSHDIRNNLATGSGGTITALTGGMAASNSWQLSVTVNASDFVNQMEAEALQPRQADGSLPGVGFMHLVAGSDLIDKGENVGLPYSGSAPDLGAFEYGAVMTGTGGAGGATGVGGRGGQGGTGGGAGNGAAGRGGQGGTAGAAGAGTGRGGASGAAGSTGGASAGGRGGGDTSGGAGMTGSAGATGTGGASGSAGTSGGAGTSGAAGTTGAAGNSATGTAGTGVTGQGGSSGTGGAVDSGEAGCGCSTTSDRAGVLGVLLLALLAAVRTRRRLYAQARRL